MYYNVTTWCYRRLNWFSHSIIHTISRKCTSSLIICNTSLIILPWESRNAQCLLSFSTYSIVFISYKLHLTPLELYPILASFIEIQIHYIYYIRVDSNIFIVIEYMLRRWLNVPIILFREGPEGPFTFNTDYFSIVRRYSMFRRCTHPTHPHTHTHTHTHTHALSSDTQKQIISRRFQYKQIYIVSCIESLTHVLLSRSRFLRHLRSDLTRSLSFERFRADLKRLKNWLQEPIYYIFIVYAQVSWIHGSAVLILAIFLFVWIESM